MGKHRKTEPKQISMLATTGGLFATILLAAGLFGAAQIITSDKPQAPSPGKEVTLPEMPEVKQANGVIITERDSNNSQRVPAQPTKQIPSAKQSPGTATPPVVVIPTQPQPQLPQVPPVRVRVTVPPVIDAEVNAQPLIGLVNDTVDETTDLVGDVVKDTTSTVKSILDPLRK